MKAVRDELKNKWIDNPDQPAPWQLGLAAAYRAKRLKASSETSIGVTVGILIGAALALLSWKLAIGAVGLAVTVSFVFVMAAIKSKIESIEFERTATSGFKRVNLDDNLDEKQENS